MMMNKILSVALFLVALVLSNSALADRYDIYGRVIESDGLRISYMTNPGDRPDVKVVEPDGHVEFFYSDEPVIASFAHEFGDWEAIAPPVSSIEVVKFFVSGGKRRVAYVTSFYFDDDNDYRLFVLEHDSATGDWFDVIPGGSIYNDPSLNRGSWGLEVTDLNKDSLPDIVVGHTDGIRRFFSSPDNTSYERQRNDVGPEADVVRAFDVDEDGFTDLITVMWSEEFNVWYNDGLGGIREVVSYFGTHAGYNDMEIGSRNGRPELVIVSGQGLVPDFSIYDIWDDFALLHEGYNVEENTNGLAFADFNRDGKDDVVITGSGNSPVYLSEFRTDPLGETPDEEYLLVTHDIPESLEYGMINCEDELLDLAVAHGGWNTLGVYYQDPSFGLDLETRYSIPNASHYDPARGIDLGDGDGDGVTDVFVADYNNGVLFLQGSCCAIGAPADPGILMLRKTPEFVGATSVRFSWSELSARFSVTRAVTLPYPEDSAEICDGVGECTVANEARLGVGEWLQFYQLGPDCGPD